MPRRCVICEYTEEHGSPLTDRPATPDNRLTWNPIRMEWMCTECRSAITENLSDLARSEEDDENQ